MNEKMDGSQEITDMLSDFLIGIVSIFESLHTYFIEHGDEIGAYISVFKEFQHSINAAKRMREKQIIFTQDLTNDISKEICMSDDVETTVLNYYYANNMEWLNALIDRCHNSKCIEPFLNLYDQSISAFFNQYYQLSCTGLFALIDGLLSINTNMYNNTNFKKRIDVITRKISNKVALSKMDLKLFCVYLGLEDIKETMFGHRVFTDKERVDEINRNRVMHGRTTREYTAIDVIKVLLVLDSFLILNSLGDMTVQSISQ